MRPAFALPEKKSSGDGTAFIVSIMSQAAATIPQKLFFKIGEVCEIAGVQAHVLRYWETEFPMLAPQKNRAGQRTYRRRDVEMALRIKELLYDEQYTIAGAKKKLATEMRAPGKENLQPVQQKQNVRSLQPPPSLAGKFAPPPAASPGLSEDQRASLRQVALQLRDILNLLEQGDEELEQLRSQSK
jgi:DNA-binding transcriptional MerR regulator